MYCTSRQTQTQRLIWADIPQIPDLRNVDHQLLFCTSSARAHVSKHPCHLAWSMGRNSGVTTGPQTPLVGGGTLGGRHFEPPDLATPALATAHGQKLYRYIKPSDLATDKKIIGAAKIGQGAAKKIGEQKKVAIKTGVYKRSIGGGKLTPGGQHFASFRHWGRKKRMLSAHSKVRSKS